MSWFRRAALPAALLLVLAAAPAGAHEGNPNYRSVVREIVPPTDGLTAQVLDHDDSLLVVNRGDLDVVILGYDGRPYARLLGDGTVQVNSRSALAREEDDEEEGEAGASLEAVPAGAFAGPGLYASVGLLAHGGEEHAPGEHHDDHAPAEDAGGTSQTDGPQWVTLDRAGRLQWHDARINYREGGLPPQVTDRTEETKVDDWRVPIVVGGERGAILGTLTWVGEPGAGSSFPTAAVASLVVLALLAVGAVVLVRRRRADGGAV